MAHSDCDHEGVFVSVNENQTDYHPMNEMIFELYNFFDFRFYLRSNNLIDNLYAMKNFLRHKIYFYSINKNLR